LKNSCLSNDTTDPVDRKRPSPPRRPLAKIPRIPTLSRRPSNPQWRDDQILKINCVQARANQRHPIELLEVLQVGHIRIRAFCL
jgi:hypothetical protein